MQSTKTKPTQVNPLICSHCDALHFEHRVACRKCGSYSLAPSGPKAALPRQLVGVLVALASAAAAIIWMSQGH